MLLKLREAALPVSFKKFIITERGPSIACVSVLRGLVQLVEKREVVLVARLAVDSLTVIADDIPLFAPKTNDD